MARLGRPAWIYTRRGIAPPWAFMLLGGACGAVGARLALVASTPVRAVLGAAIVAFGTAVAADLDRQSPRRKVVAAVGAATLVGIGLVASVALVAPRSGGLGAIVMLFSSFLPYIVRSAAADDLARGRAYRSARVFSRAAVGVVASLLVVFAAVVPLQVASIALKQFFAANRGLLISPDVRGGLFGLALTVGLAVAGWIDDRPIGVGRSDRAAR